jgi:endonuclease YncB( thermonuclease family)
MNSKEQFIELLKTTNCDNIPFFSLDGYCTWGKVVKCYDGDTIWAIFILNNCLTKFKCRLYGIDCAEIKSKDNTEINYAQKAIRRVNELTFEKLVYIKCYKFEKWGRLLIDIYNEDDLSVSINDKLINEGLAYPYFGGTKKEFKEWGPCNSMIETRELNDEWLSIPDDLEIFDGKKHSDSELTICAYGYKSDPVYMRCGPKKYILDGC